METITVKARIRKHKESAEVAENDFFLDTGVPCALAPAEVLRRLGIEADGEERIFVGMETYVRKTGTAYFELAGRGGYAKVMFGEPGDNNLIAKSTLKALGLWVHPFTRELGLLPTEAKPR